jgi:hypothetical protein
MRRLLLALLLAVFGGAVDVSAQGPAPENPRRRTFNSTAEADISTPSTDKAYLFYDAGTMKFKKDDGSVVSLGASVGGTLDGIGSALRVPYWSDVDTLGFTKILLSGANRGTVQVYDDTAVTGVTELRAIGGAGQTAESDVITVTDSTGASTHASISKQGRGYFTRHISIDEEGGAFGTLTLSTWHGSPSNGVALTGGNGVVNVVQTSDYSTAANLTFGTGFGNVYGARFQSTNNRWYLLETATTHVATGQRGLNLSNDSTIGWTDNAHAGLGTYDVGLERASSGVVGVTDGTTGTGNLSVATEVYGAGWDADLTVPTKDAVYDKIETISGGLSGLTTGNIHYADSATTLAVSPLYRTSATEVQMGADAASASPHRIVGQDATGGAAAGGALELASGLSGDAATGASGVYFFGSRPSSGQTQRTLGRIYGSTSSRTEMRVYGEYTDASNNAYIRVVANDATDAILWSSKLGTATGRSLSVGSDVTGAVLYLTTEGNNRWIVQANGHLRPNTDLAVDLGASTSRVGSTYVGTAYAGSQQKVLADNTLTGFATVSVPTNGQIVAGTITYTVEVTDETGGTANQAETGTIPFTLVNEGGTLRGTIFVGGGGTGALNTATIIRDVDAGTLSNIFAVSISTTTATFQITSDTSITADANRHRIRWRFNVPTNTDTVTITAL